MDMDTPTVLVVELVGMPGTLLHLFACMYCFPLGTHSTAGMHGVWTRMWSFAGKTWYRWHLWL